MILFDIETNGFLDTLDAVHCLVIHDTEIGTTLRFRGSNIRVGLQFLSSQPAIGGHNVIKFDLPALEKVYGWWYDGDVYDTLVASRLAFADIKDADLKLFKKGSLPGKLIGSHALKAWGYRLGELKGTYAEDAAAKLQEAGVASGENCWDHWTQEMEDYCAQDVQVTVKLYQKLQERKLTPLSLWLEHEFCKVIARQERRGVRFNRDAAEKLWVELLAAREEAGRKLKEVFGSWKVKGKTFTPKRDNKKYGYKAGVPVTKWKTVEFNPASRDHIANRLMVLRGWKPIAFTDGGKPKVDEKIISKLTYPEVPGILEYLFLDKRLGMIAEGDQAWLQLEKNGRIYGSINTNGAVTGRVTHAKPNLGQVPKVGKRFGAECRALFGPSEGMVLVGCDASGAQLRCLAHYMARWDKGDYVKVLLEGDIHSANQKAIGLPNRDMAKTWVYAYLFGAGDAKLGSFMKGGREEGRKLRAKFQRNIPALGKLVDAVKEATRTKGFLVGLDGRHIHIRSAHAALNSLLQGAEAVLMKFAVVLADWLLQHEGMVPGVDYENVLFVHDEIQIEAKPDKAEQVGQILASAIQAAGAFFNFRCPLAGEYKIGANWAETH